MNVTIELDLPDALVKEARANGLLDSKRLAELLSNELRRERARRQFVEALENVRGQPGEPMSMDEIQAEVNAVREERRRREGSR
jgi:TATA-binding protein-associated factor Taf7